jgi:hypothetical protein
MEKIIIRIPIELTDTEYFCNKSWTLSYNMNTKSWISFHSYIPNFYIAENNFFYSGKNDCCNDFDFDFMVGVPTADTTTTTTTTTWHPDCRLEAYANIITTSTTTTTSTLYIDCRLEGIADIITTTSTTTSSTSTTTSSTSTSTSTTTTSTTALVVLIGNDQQSSSFTPVCTDVDYWAYSVNYVVLADTHFAITKELANAAAINDVNMNGQIFANTTGQCNPPPPPSPPPPASGCDTFVFAPGNPSSGVMRVTMAGQTNPITTSWNITIRIQDGTIIATDTVAYPESGSAEYDFSGLTPGIQYTTTMISDCNCCQSGFAIVLY